MFISNKNQIITRHKQPTKEKGSAYSSYQAKRTQDLEKLKRLLKNNPDAEIYVGNNWIRVQSITFNGITKEQLLNIVNEIQTNTCNIANIML